MTITRQGEDDNAFHHFRTLGYRTLLPIVPPTADVSERSTLHAHIGTPNDPRGKAPGVRGWSGQWYGFDWLKHQTTEDDLRRWHGMGAGVGLRLGEGLYALDVDTLDPFLSEIVWRELVNVTTCNIARRIGRAPKFLVLLRCDEPLKYTRVEFAGHEGKRERVELLGAGRQCVVHGVHPITGKPYTWDPKVPEISELCVVSAAMIGRLFQRLQNVLPECSFPIEEAAERAPDQSTLRGELETVRKAVEALPNTTALYPSREDYLKVGYAIKAALPDDSDAARELFLDWCSRWHDDPKGEGNDLERAVSDWQRMKPPYGVGAGWLYEQADQHGGADFREADLWFNDETSTLVFGLDTEQPGPAAHARRKLRVIPIDELAALALQDDTVPLVDGLLDPGTFSGIYGPSNIGKSFVALDIAAAVALGRPWNGRAVSQGAVVYVVAEGGRGALKRFNALLKAAGVDKMPGFGAIMTPIDLSKDGADVQPLIDAIAVEEARLEQKVALVVLDTLARVMFGGDENSSVDMGALIRNFDRIRERTKTHLMVIHHTGKDTTKGARGHSSLRASLDTEIELGEGTFTVMKQRDIETNLALRFEIVGHDVGHGPRGQAVTSATVRWLNEKERPLNTKPTPLEAVILATMEGYDEPNRGCLVEDLAKIVGKSPKQTRGLLYALTGKGWVRSDEASKNARWFRCMSANDAFGGNVVPMTRPADENARKGVFG